MKTIDLHEGNWFFLGMEPQAGGIDKPDLNSPDWLPIDVPGDINAALLGHGKIPDPLFDTQARESYWVTGRDWWYKLEFDSAACSGAKTDICVESADGHADFWLNNHYLGETKNAFRLHRFNLAGKLKTGKNALMVRFQSVDQILGSERKDELGGWFLRRAFMRRPQFSFGWDWALPLPSIGLNGKVWLEADNGCRLQDFSISPFVSGRVDFSFEVSKEAQERNYEIALNVNGHGADIRKRLRRKSFKSYISLQIENPELWYPNGYGAPNLYGYRIDLIVEGLAVDSHRGYFGIRESRIAQNPFTPGSGPGFSFEVQVNGHTIFCKGANWVPIELWPAVIKPEQYEFYIRKAATANFNMLRVWGGGLYEPDLFYDLCDKYGIMVWQDFMFASSPYPVDLLRDEITAEADYQIRRLRNHPCVVIWCGCNEDVYSWKHPDATEHELLCDDNPYPVEADKKWQVDRLKADPQIYTMILRGMVGKLGLGAPYVESSPQSRDDYGNVPNSGNSHISCWKYALFAAGGSPEHFRKHFEDVCSFNSEFCIQGPCAEKSFKKFMAPENLWPPGESWIYHIQRGHNNLPHHEQTLLIAGAVFGEIDSLQKYVKHGQATHSEMMRAEFESARRDRPDNGGTMVWMYNDCWPTSNWSIIDYYRNPKPSYYAAKRACSPWLPIIFERKGEIGFFFGNDSLASPRAELVYGQQTIEGKHVWSKKQSLKIASNSTLKFDGFTREELSFDSGDYFFICAVAEGRHLPPVVYFPDGWKDIEWPEPGIDLIILEQKQLNSLWETRLRVKTNKFARFCHLLYSDRTGSSGASGHPKTFFSDNYFDLPAGAELDITVYSAEKPDLDNFRIGHWLTEWE